MAIKPMGVMARMMDVFQRPWPQRLLALAAGAMLPLAYAPFEIRPLAWLSLLILLALWFRASPRRALGIGFAFGLGMFGAGASWIYNSIHLFGEAVAPLAFVITLGFVAVMALYPALAGGLANRLAPAGSPLRLLVAYPLAWGLFEWLRGWLFSGFPWLNLGAAQLDTPFEGWLPVVGEYGTGMIVVLALGSALMLLHGWRERAGVLLAGTLGLGLWLSMFGWTQPAGEPV